MAGNLYAFQTLGQLLCWWNSNNPARARSINLLEPDKRSSPENRGGYEPDELWAKLTYVIAATLRDEPREVRIAWQMRNCGDREGHWAVEDIAREMSLPPRTIYRFLREVNEQLERVFVAQGVLHPDVFERDVG